MIYPAKYWGMATEIITDPSCVLYFELHQPDYSLVAIHSNLRDNSSSNNAPFQSPIAGLHDLVDVIFFANIRGFCDWVVVLLCCLDLFVNLKIVWRLLILKYQEIYSCHGSDFLRAMKTWWKKTQFKPPPILNILGILSSNLSWKKKKKFFLTKKCF